jgi:hypothetical protein
MKDRYIEPHSPEWFAMLMVIDAKQAALVVKVIEHTGTRECCTICGELESKIYDPVGNVMPTIRLCDDCKKIQTEQFGAVFTALKKNKQVIQDE